MGISIISLVLFILVIVFSLTMLFFDNLMHSVIFFTVINVLFGLFYISLDYTLLGIFHLTVYTVSMAGLFFYTVSLTGGVNDK